jgi:PEP-CTERM motif
MNSMLRYLGLAAGIASALTVRPVVAAPITYTINSTVGTSVIYDITSAGFHPIAAFPGVSIGQPFKATLTIDPSTLLPLSLNNQFPGDPAGASQSSYTIDFTLSVETDIGGTAQILQNVSSAGGMCKANVYVVDNISGNDPLFGGQYMFDQIGISLAGYSSDPSCALPSLSLDGFSLDSIGFVFNEIVSGSVNPPGYLTSSVLGPDWVGLLDTAPIMGASIQFLLQSPNIFQFGIVRTIPSTPVPEPSSVALFALGSLGLLGLRRRREKRTA